MVAVGSMVQKVKYQKALELLERNFQKLLVAALAELEAQ